MDIRKCNYSIIMNYICKRCGFEFTQKSSLKTHLQCKKRCCNPLLADISIEVLLNELEKTYNDVTYDCTLCNKKFNTKQSMYRHRKMCAEKQEQASKNTENTHQLVPADDNSEMTVLQRQIAILQNTVDGLIQKINEKSYTTINNNNNNNNNNYTTNNVLVLNNFGEESIQHLTDHFLLEVFKDKDPGYLAQQIHFSREVPENQNLRLKDDTTIEIFRNNKWIPQDIDMTLTDLFRSDWRFLRVRCTTMKKKVILEKKINREDYDNTLEWWETMCKDAKMQEDFKEDILVTMRDDIEFGDD